MKTKLKSLDDASLVDVVGSGYGCGCRPKVVTGPNPNLVSQAIKSITNLAIAGLNAQTRMINLFNNSMTRLLTGFSKDLIASQNLIAKLGSVRFPVLS